MRGRSFKRWLARVRQGRAGLGGLFLLSAGETTVVPVPVELALIPMMQFARRQVWRMAAVVTLGALAGAVIGYAFAAFFMETLGNALIAGAGWQAEHARFAELFDRYGFLAIVLVGMLPPIPFQLAIVSAGATGYPFGLFVLATLIARGLRYFTLAALVWLFGDWVANVYRNNRTQAIAAAIGLFCCLAGLAWAFERFGT